ncbi:unnamed protein product [Acanthosepion pharaonis]|uniref:RING-type domain-containing protein n=1 Tax=Acanthosepion pharaonis TaxID=158019 RepID=A0A812DB38_ACAPH|nr:unnamed protein product [Sepia pharaonis]
MVDWLHCNLCFTQPGNGIKFSLTNCGHVYCEKCLTEGTKESCKMCKAVCSSILLTGKMKPDVEIFFGDPSELIKKQNKQLVQVMEFQKNHRRRFVTYLKDKVSKQNAYISQVKQALMARQVLQRDIAKLKEENLYLKRLVSEKGLNASSRNSTPGRTGFPSYRASPSRSPIENMSPYPYSKPNTPISNTSRCNTPSNYLSQLTESRNTQSNMSINYLPQMPARVSIRTPPTQGRLETPCIPIISESPTPTIFDVSKKFSR